MGSRDRDREMGSRGRDREMGSRESDQRQPTVNNLSSLIIRPEESGGGGSDYEPGEVRPDHREPSPPYSRPQRFSDNPGYGMLAASGSPLRQRKVDRQFSPDFDHSPLRQRKVDRRFSPEYDHSPLRQRKVDRHYSPDFNHPVGPDFNHSVGPRRGRGFRGGRGPERFREYTPPFGRGRGGRSFGRGFGGPGFGPESRDESVTRNNPNVSPREGDWLCRDPGCGNLNFAWRAHCNNCNKLRFPPGDSGPRRRYLSPPPMGRSRGRGTNSYRSPPPRDWSREGPRDFGMGPPPPRHGGRFPDRNVRRERPDYQDDDEYRGRGKFDRLMPPEWGNPRDRGRDGDEFLLPERRGFDDRPMMPNRGRWPRESRERSRSPMRGGPKDYHRDSYAGRGRGRLDRRGMGRGVY